MANKNRDMLQSFLLFLSVLLALSLMTVLFLKYRNARNELIRLRSDLSASTSVWKQINEDKLIVQRELKAAKNNLREANLTIEESENKAKELEADIAELEKEINVLKSSKP